MTKHIILFFAALCSLHNHANAAPSDSDTVRYESFSNGIEMLRPMQPSYLDGVVVPTRKSGNWFVSLSGGASAFLGTPLGCEDLFGRLKPSYTIGVGNGSHRRSASVSITAGCISRTVNCPHRKIIMSMRI